MRCHNGAYWQGYLPTPTTAPNSNLTIDFDILQNGTEKKAEYGHLLTATQDVTLTVKVCNNSSTDTTEGRVKGGSKTDTRFWVRLPGQGNWSDLGREETKDQNLRANTCHTEKKSYTIPNSPGNTIAFRAKVDDRGEITESNEDDNQSRDEVFTIGAPPVPTQSYSSDQRFAWSSSGPIASMHCTQILEAADPHTWNDNYFCADRDYGIQWRSWGAIPGMRCTQITEAADPYTWNDNYLCVPHSSQLRFTWSSAGPIAGKDCVQWVEAADPHTWMDNYLCIGTYTPPPPTVTFTNPSPGEKWKSNKTYTIRWYTTNMPTSERIRIDYYNSGRWTTVAGAHNTANDGSKRWRMRDNRTKDDHGSRLRIVRLSDNKVIGVSHTFFIDRKKGTPKW